MPMMATTSTTTTTAVNNGHELVFIDTRLMGATCSQSMGELVCVCVGLLAACMRLCARPICGAVDENCALCVCAAVGARDGALVDLAANLLANAFSPFLSQKTLLLSLVEMHEKMGTPIVDSRCWCCTAAAELDWNQTEHREELAWWVTWRSIPCIRESRSRAFQALKCLILIGCTLDQQESIPRWRDCMGRI